MIEEVAENIYRIGVTLPDNPLKELNSYFIRGNERDLLIDTGFRREECREALEQGLKELNSKAERRDILATHIHSDHSGMADLFAGPDSTIYMSRVDLELEKRELNGEIHERRNARFLSEGFGEELLEKIHQTNPARTMCLPAVDDRFTGLEDQEEIQVGDYVLKMLLVPGHTPGNIMLWAEKQGILFSGDHVLFDITPNITQWEIMEDSLGDYLESLKKYENLQVNMTLPGHRKTGDYQKRVRELIHHHHNRLQDCLDIVKSQSGMTAYEIAGRMGWKIRARSWEEFPPVQKWFAVGECLSHLDHLRKTGVVSREQKDGKWHYYLV